MGENFARGKSVHNALEKRSRVGFPILQRLFRIWAITAVIRRRSAGVSHALQAARAPGSGRLLTAYTAFLSGYAVGDLYFAPISESFEMIAPFSMRPSWRYTSVPSLS